MKTEQVPMWKVLPSPGEPWPMARGGPAPFWLYREPDGSFTVWDNQSRTGYALTTAGQWINPRHVPEMCLFPSKAQALATLKANIEALLKEERGC